MSDLADFLKENNLEDLKEIFKQEDIDFATLQMMSFDHISKMNISYGRKICLDFAIKKLNKQNLPQKNTSVDSTIYLDDNTDDQPSSKRICLSAINLNLPSFLTKNVVGAHILTTFESKKMLVAEDRKTICRLVIEEMLRQSNSLKANDFLAAANAICRLFPSETPEAYYLPYSKGMSQARGKLVDKYRNLKKKLQNIMPTCAFNETDDPQDPNIEIDLEWLRNHSQPEKEVLERWQVTSKTRLKKWTEMNSLTLAGIIQDFPALKMSFAPSLIQLDFEFLYPDKKDALLSNWMLLQEKIKRLLEHLLKDDVAKMLLDSIDALHENLKLRNLFRLLLKHIPPTVVISKGKKYHPSQAEALDSFILILKESSLLEQEIERKKTFAKNRGIKLQPFLVFIEEEVHSCLIFLDDIFYKVSDLVTGLDILFKIFMVFNLEYPIESVQLWLFIQHGFYKIRHESDKKYPAVATLVKSLENYE